jgi:SpoVK/Ycf46/Vps4 family AAA+-type ATPase
MAGRHLKALMAAYRDKDDLAFRRAAQAIIEEEEGKKHVALARDLRRLLAAGSGVHMPVDNAPLPESPRDRDTDLPLTEVRSSGLLLDDLVLDTELHARLHELIREVPAWPELDAAGVPRRRSLLLYGPPGCGKSSIATALAGELGWPLVTVRTETLVSSYLGETASNLNRVFEFASSGPYLVLFDEFDSLGKMRDDPTDHGELRRVVNAVLQLIDRYRGPSLLVAATNHQHVLDPALWRRFSEVLEVPLPTADQRRVLLTRTVRGHVGAGIDLDPIVNGLDGLPHAAAELVGHDALRLAILGGRTAVTQADLQESLSRTTRRPWR